MRIRAVTRGGIAALITLLVLSFGTASVVNAEGSGAGIGLVEWVLGLDGGMGVAGGTVGVTLTLEGPQEPPVSVGIDLVYPPDDLEFIEPVSENCVLVDRLQDTHLVAGRVLTPGEVNVEVLVNPSLPDTQQPLGEGDVVTCSFAIPLGVPNGTVAVMIDNPFLGDADGQGLPVQTRPGAVVIGPEPTPTFTATIVPPTITPTAAPTDTATEGPTSTPIDTPTEGPSPTPTDTATEGPSPTPTDTAAPTATSTSRPPATATARPQQSDADDTCAIVPVKDSNPLSSMVLLLVPGVLLWARRRSL